jgi:hypothetical protein
MNKKETDKLLDQVINLKLQVNRLDKEWAEQYDKVQKVQKEFTIFKIMTHLINNGMEKDMAKVMAVDSYNMSLEVQV